MLQVQLYAVCRSAGGNNGCTGEQTKIWKKKSFNESFTDHFQSLTSLLILMKRSSYHHLSITSAVACQSVTQSEGQHEPLPWLWNCILLLQLCGMQWNKPAGSLRGIKPIGVKWAKWPLFTIPLRAKVVKSNFKKQHFSSQLCRLPSSSMSSSLYDLGQLKWWRFVLKYCSLGCGAQLFLRFPVVQVPVMCQFLPLAASKREQV